MEVTLAGTVHGLAGLVTTTGCEKAMPPKNRFAIKKARPKMPVLCNDFLIRFIIVVRKNDAVCIFNAIGLLCFAVVRIGTTNAVAGPLAVCEQLTSAGRLLVRGFMVKNSFGKMKGDFLYSGKKNDPARAESLFVFPMKFFVAVVIGQQGVVLLQYATDHAAAGWEWQRRRWNKAVNVFKNVSNFLITDGFDPKTVFKKTGDNAVHHPFPIQIAVGILHKWICK